MTLIDTTPPAAVRVLSSEDFYLAPDDDLEDLQEMIFNSEGDEDDRDNDDPWNPYYFTGPFTGPFSSNF